MSGPAGSAGTARLKRRLLSEAVAENVALIEGRRRSPPGRRRSPLRWTIGFVSGAVAAAALAVVAAPRLDPRPEAAGGLAASSDGAFPRAAGDRPAPVRVAGEVFPLALRRVVIDPGHGGGDLGTSIGELHEKEITLDLALRLRSLLAAAGYEVHLTRERDHRLSLRERARIANDLPADLFVSIHVNWIADERGSRGVETYHLGPTDDPYLTRLASAENAESGYSRADIRDLLEGIYQDLRQEESAAVAGSIQRSLHRSLVGVNPTLEDRGVKTAPFLVLVATEMPAVLAEVSSLSNREEADLLAQPEYRDRIARALLAGVESYAGQSRPATGGARAERSASR